MHAMTSDTLTATWDWALGETWNRPILAQYDGFGLVFCHCSTLRQKKEFKISSKIDEIGSKSRTRCVPKTFHSTALNASPPHKIEYWLRHGIFLVPTADCGPASARARPCPPPVPSPGSAPGHWPLSSRDRTNKKLRNLVSLFLSFECSYMFEME